MKIKTNFDYDSLFRDIATGAISPDDKMEIYKSLVLNDLYFLMRYVLNYPFVEHPWIYDRINEVQSLNNMTIDLWARGHMKSTIITQSLTIQQLLQDPSLTFIIFSHTNPIAHDFLRTIKNILKGNDFLRSLFPDIIPEAKSNLLSDTRVTLLPNRTRKEANIEASGLVDGQPTSKHYDWRIYDDVVVPESVTTPEQMRKLKDRFQMSMNLGSMKNMMRVIGTRYHKDDLFADLLEQDIYTARIYPAVDENGRSVFFEEELLQQKRTTNGSYNFATQYLLDPVQKETCPFRMEDIQYYNERPENIRKTVLLCDPAISTSKTACYAVVMVLAVTDDHKVYVLDYSSGRGWSPNKLADEIYKLHCTYKPRALGIEQVGYQAALKYIVEEKFQKNGRYVLIDALKPSTSKGDRILALQPYIENHAFFVKEDQTELVDEITNYPYYKYNDHIDVAAYVLDYLDPIHINNGAPVNNRHRAESLMDKYQLKRKIARKESIPVNNLKRGSINPRSNEWQ